MDNAKKRCCVCFTEDTTNLINSLYKLDNCANKSVFVERAVKFYAGYVSSNGLGEYTSSVVSDSVSRCIGSFENRMAKMLFKFSVEQAIMMNLYALYNDIDKDLIDKLRGQCVEVVKRTKGSFSFDDAVIWQKGRIDEQGGS